MSANKDLQHLHVAEIVEHMRDHPDPSHVWLADRIDAFVRFVGHVVCWINAVLILAIIGNVFMRYGLGNSQAWVEELQWHLYAVGVMFGISYAQVNDAHIRVDILHMQFSDRTKRYVEIFGILVFVLPFVFIVFDHSLDFVADALRTNERSDSPLGLPHRWIIKSVIPLSFGLFGLAAISRLIRDVVVLVRGKA